MRQQLGKRPIRKLLIVFLFLISTNASAAIHGRFFGDFNITASYDNSVFRDASKKADGLFPVSAGIGWKGRLTKSTVSRTYYRFSYRSFAKETLETYREHYVESSIRQRLYGPLSLNLNFEGEIFNQPNFARFDSNRFLYQPGLELRVLPETLIKGAFIYETQDYPNFDLDYKSPGFKFEAVQDITLYGDLTFSYTQQTKNYQERRQFLNASGTLSQEERKDDEKQLEIVAEGNWRYGGLSAGYSYFDLSSNGNFIDFGANQSANFNTTLSDDRLISNYYSHTAKGPFFGGNLRIFKFILASISYRLRDLNFDGRIAKNQVGAFVEGEPKRKDDRNILSLQLTFLQPVQGLTLGWSLGWNREKSSSNDSLYQFDNNQFLLAFRGWF